MVVCEFLYEEEGWECVTLHVTAWAAAGKKQELAVTKLGRKNAEKA